MPSKPEIAKIRSLLKLLEDAEFTVTHEARATKKTLAEASGELGFELPPELAEYFKEFGGIYVGGGSAPRNFYALESAVLRTSEYRSEFDNFRNEPGGEGLPDAFVVVFDRGTLSNAAEGVIYDAKHEKLWATDDGRYGADDCEDECSIWELVVRELEDLLANDTADEDGAQAGFEPDEGLMIEALDRIDAKHQTEAKALAAVPTAIRARRVTQWSNGFVYHPSLTADERSRVAAIIARLGGEGAHEGASVVLGSGATIADRYALRSVHKTLVELEDLVRAIPSDDPVERRRHLDGLLAKPSHRSWEEIGMLLATWPEASRREAIAAVATASWDEELRWPLELFNRHEDTRALPFALGATETLFVRDDPFDMAAVLAVPGCRSLIVSSTKLKAPDIQALASSALGLRRSEDVGRPLRSGAPQRGGLARPPVKARRRA